MDIASAVSRVYDLTAGVPPSLVGKWLESAIRGRFIVDDIRISSGGAVPIARVLVYHYIIGIILTANFYIIVLWLKLTDISWWAPLFYGVLTTLIPSLLMFPGMGFGFFGSSGPQEYLLMRTAAVNHLFFGFGMAITFPVALKMLERKQ